jgi:hypothetical protein
MEAPPFTMGALAASEPNASAPVVQVASTPSTASGTDGDR